MTKLTSAQAYALQVKSDRRAEALDRIAKGTAYRAITTQVTEPKAKKRVSFTHDEVAAVVAAYLSTNGDYRKANFKALSSVMAAHSGASSVRGLWSQIRSIDTQSSYDNFVRHGKTLVRQLQLANEGLGFNRFAV
jgi:hypothetical protein